MNLLRRLALSLVVFALVTMLSACGGKAVTLAELPIPPEARPLESGSNPLADQIASSLLEAYGDIGSSSEVAVYALPATTSWEQLKSFYIEQLAGSDWRNEPELDRESETLSMIAWGRGSFASEQALSVAFVPPILGGDPLLLLALVSE